MLEFEITRHEGRVDGTRRGAAEVAALRQLELLDAESKTMADYSESDSRSVHFVARDGEHLAGYVQYDPEGNRMRQIIVAAEYRGGDLGRILVEHVREEARRRGEDELCVHAWVRSLGFYLRVGFEPTGGVITDAMVPWQTMTMRLDD